jgi:peptide/nickel transport system permease protein
VSAVVAKRLLELLLTLFVASLVIFAALYVVPGGPIPYLLHGQSATPAAVARVTAEYHLDEAFIPRYLHWLGGVIHGDFGASLVYKESAWNLLKPRLEVTALLVVVAALQVWIVGALVGTVAALRRGITEAGLMSLVTIGVGIPSFVAASALISVFAVSLGWFPVSGPGSGFLGHLDHVILPATALAISGIALMGRLTRASVRHELRREYVDTATASGLTRRQTVWRHVLRNSAPPMLTAAGICFVGLMASEVVVESAFGVNGLGSLLVQSVGAKDFSVVQAIVLLYVTVFMVINTVTDLIALKIDPRLMVAARRSL